MKKYILFVLLALIIATPVFAGSWSEWWRSLFQPTADSQTAVISGPAIGQEATPQSLCTWPYGCLPQGSANQTLRHNGAAWVVDSTITNTGVLIGINETSFFNEANPTLTVKANTPSGGYDGSGTAIYGINNATAPTHVGVRGFGPRGVLGHASADSQYSAGVFGFANGNQNSAVFGSQGGSGYGFYQEGTSAKNKFESRLEVGNITANPPAMVEVMGDVCGTVNGSRKCVSQISGGGSMPTLSCVQIEGSSGSASCPDSSYKISGGGGVCSTTPLLFSYKVTGSTWTARCQDGSDPDNSPDLPTITQAICCKLQ